MYINKLKIGAIRTTAKIGMWIWGAMTALSMIAVIGGFVDDDLNEYLWYYVAFVAICVVPLLFSIRKFRRVRNAERFNAIFTEDHDGVLTLQTIARMFGKSEEKTEKELSWFWRKNCFQNLTYDYGQKVIRLSDSIKKKSLLGLKTEAEDSFVGMNCPNCGGALRLRAGSGDKCPFCGSYVRADGKA